jgi:hypothetical protein
MSGQTYNTSHTSVNTLELLKEWIASNPNRNKGLDMPQAEQKMNHRFPCKPTDWFEFNVQPAGPITALFLLKDPLFGQAAPGLRAQMQLEKHTELTEKIDGDMRSGKLMRMRRKMHEWLAADPSRLTPETLADVWDILCTVCDIQTICVEDTGSSAPSITFSPANVTLWRPDVPIHIVERKLSKVWVYVGAPNTLRRGIASWLSDMEELGAKITYPSMESSKVEMVDFLEVLPSWKETMRKMKKEELAPIAGRAQVLELFNEWMELTPQAQVFCDDGF